MSAPAVTEKDHGYAELKKRWLNHRNGRGVVLGIFGEGAAQAPEGGEDGVTNLLLAIIHEWGAPNASIPARAWLRGFVDENRDEIIRRVRALSRRVYKNEISYDDALTQLGLWLEGACKARMARGLEPPIAESTRRSRMRKRSRQRAAAQAAAIRKLYGVDEPAGSGGPAGAVTLKPLIDTGQFRQSITSEVRDR